MLNIHNAISLRDLLLCSNNERMHSDTSLRVRYNEKNKKRGKLKKIYETIVAVLERFFFLFFSFFLCWLNYLSAFALSFSSYIYYISRVITNSFFQTYWTGRASYINIYIRRKEKSSFLVNSISFYECKQVSIFFVLPVPWLRVKYSFFSSSPYSFFC